ncbi:MAG: hypothetical protein ACXVNF_09530 [Neobacillus sp.]
MSDLKFEGLNSEDNMAWMLKRISKGIKLSGALCDYVGCSYAHLAQWEKKDKHPMAEDKIERYKAFIDAYPNPPEGVVTKEDKFKDK